MDAITPIDTTSISDLLPEEVLITDEQLPELTEEVEFEEELIIEDFTIDGICGVY